MLPTDELLERIGDLERTKRFWKVLALCLVAALAVFLMLGAGLGFAMFFHAQDQRMEAQRLMDEVRQQEAVARQQAEQAEERAKQALDAVEKAKQAAEKEKGHP